MNLDTLLLAVILLILVSLVCVRLATVAKLGSILGFLIAGILLGPNTPGPAVTTHVDQLLTIGELGVVLLMFTVGLEMNATRLWSMREFIFGLGPAQIGLSGALIAGALFALTDLRLDGALVLGFGLSLTSTAVVLQLLSDKGETATEDGRASFGVLVMQDLAAVPMLIVLSVLAVSPNAPSQVPWYLDLALALTAVAALLAVARWILPRALTWAVRLSSMSNFSAIVIVMVMAAAVLMDLVGLSMAMGAFLVGVMLSASDFRLQVQSTVLPLKGLFMGLYFIAVGMSIDVSFAIRNISHLLMLLVIVELCKIFAMIAAASVFRLSRDTVIKTAFLLAPCGEFGFVLFAEARSSGVISENAFAYALVIVSLSMAITPFVVAIGYAIAQRIRPVAEAPSPLNAASEDLQGHVVIAGYNRAGRMLCMMLERAGVRYIAFDRLYSRVRDGRAEGHAVEFGDVSNPAMQGAAAIAKAKLVAVMLEDPEQASQVAQQLRGFYPSVLIYVSVPDLVTRDSLRQRGISDAIATTVEGNLLLADRVLKDTGMPEADVEQLVADFRKDDYALLREHHA